MIDFIRADHVHISVPPERLEEAKDFYTGDIIGLDTDRTASPPVFFGRLLVQSR